MANNQARPETDTINVRRSGCIARRVFDVITALLAAALLAPLLVLVAAVIMLTMGRPVLFRQPRSGRDGRVFQVAKFRTMRAEKFAGESDAARTPTAGRLLRAASLDELPQLWNILRGQMSVIGPRPTLPEQVAMYSSRERGRLTVRPGLTGWAQINGRNAISWPERIELDLWYIQHRSLSLDLKILLRTVLAVLCRGGIVGTGGINPGFPSPRAALGEVLPVATVEADG
ncbi:MAG TPA: sugar transferase [Sporichthyaceae bacterium]|jgi:lipopolysaccharide/colanic/teichoic acid biosynthesis glycosyltransferase